VILHGPDKTHELAFTLKLVEALESAHGSLYEVAEGLLDKSLPLSEMVDILKTLYRHAGCETEDEALGDFLLSQPCTEILITMLLEILEPVERASALPSARFLSEMSGKFPDAKEK
jgi:hypothetical protein